LNASDAASAPSRAALNVNLPADKVRAAAGEPDWLQWARFIFVAGELALLLYVISKFDLVDAAFTRLATYAWAGFVVHHCLPRRWQLPFFSCLSVASVMAAAGGPMGLVVVAVGLALVAVCHLPIAFRLRVVLLVLVGIGLAVLRAGFVKTGFVSTTACAILGTLFMFRLVIYMYDLSHQAAPFSPVRAIAYFFMAPSAFFPLFPVVDYKTFWTTRYNDVPFHIYQRGLQWILRGVVQLLLYRVVCQLGLVAPQDVTDLGGVVRFMIATYLLYLRVSGSFHLIVGVLHLFGFNLPETHHRYFLASSFLDLWRRINIYWKDFIQKIFFYPAYFRLKRLGPTWALALATAYAFFFTWVLHAYQLFWVCGTMTWNWQDAVFWWVLAGLVLVNALHESRHSSRRALTTQRRTVHSEVGRMLCVTGTFAVWSLLWTVWSCKSVDELFVLANAAIHVNAASVATIVLVIAVLGVSTVLFGHSTAEGAGQRPRAATPAKQRPFWRPAFGVALTAAGLLVVQAFPLERVEDTKLGEIVKSLRGNQLTRMEMADLLRGYYEDLDGAGGTANREDDWPAQRYLRFTHDFMTQEAIPNTFLEWEGKTITINRWGLRDHDYIKAKPPGTYRIAVLGASAESGWGVSDAEICFKVLEERLNEQDVGGGIQTGFGGIQRYEVMNFSVPGYGGFQKLEALERLALDFDPDAVLFVTYMVESVRTIDSLPQVIHNGYEIPEAYRDVIRAAVREAGVEPSMSLATIRERLKPRGLDLVGWIFQRFAEQCRKRGLPACVVYRPDTAEYPKLHAEHRQAIVDLAEKAGLPVLDLVYSFDGVDNRQSIMLSPPTGSNLQGWTRKRTDYHPTARGHQLLADELYRLLHTDAGRPLLTARKLSSHPPGKP
jgi:hypothetical protein